MYLFLHVYFLHVVYHFTNHSIFIRWVDSIVTTEIVTHVLAVHRYQLDQLEPHQVVF